jgi:hypothetical protein
MVDLAGADLRPDEHPAADEFMTGWAMRGRGFGPSVTDPVQLHDASRT